jgi:hypothetical protein
LAAQTNRESLRAESPVNENRVAAYRRLIEAERLLYELLQRRGLTGPALDGVFDDMQNAGGAAESDVETYLSIVSAEVAALGGHLELRAVFPDETVTLLGPTETTR